MLLFRDHRLCYRPLSTIPFNSVTLVFQTNLWWKAIFKWPSLFFLMAYKSYIYILKRMIENKIGTIAIFVKYYWWNNILLHYEDKNLHLVLVCFLIIQKILIIFRNKNTPFYYITFAFFHVYKMIKISFLLSSFCILIFLMENNCLILNILLNVIISFWVILELLKSCVTLLKLFSYRLGGFKSFYDNMLQAVMA